MSRRMPLAVIAARSSILINVLSARASDLLTAYNDKTVLRGGYGMMYTRRGAVGGRENARTGTGLTGINASAPHRQPEWHVHPALYWDNGIPAYATGPIYDETYQSGFANGTRDGRRRDLWRSGQPTPSLSELEPLDPALAYSFVSLDCGLRGKQWQTVARGRARQLVKSDRSQISGLGESAQRKLRTRPTLRSPRPLCRGSDCRSRLSRGQSLRRYARSRSTIASPILTATSVNRTTTPCRFSLQQRLSNGLTFNVNYTFSKALGTINGSRSAYLQEKNLSTTDQPHVFNAFYSYELPFGKGRMFDPENKVVRALVSGWQISGITRFASGTPLGPFTANLQSCRQAGTCWASYNPNFTGSCGSTEAGATAT